MSFFAYTTQCLNKGEFHFFIAGHIGYAATPMPITGPSEVYCAFVSCPRPAKSPKANPDANNNTFFIKYSFGYQLEVKNMPSRACAITI